jgi:hypothetical protein
MLLKSLPVAVAGCPFLGPKTGPNRTLKHYPADRPLDSQCLQDGFGFFIVVSLYHLCFVFLFIFLLIIVTAFLVMTSDDW